MILCFGDSITQGRPGVTYLKYVRDRREFVNFGLGGDTLAGMTVRLKNAFCDAKYSNADTVIIGIGTNDVLHPYLRGFSKSWTKIVGRLIGRGSVPCSDETEFRVRYEELLKMLADTDKKVIIFGIPLLETNVVELNVKAEAYNRIIRELCGELGVYFIDIMELQSEIKTKLNNHGAKFFSSSILEPVFLTVFTTYLPFTDQVSKNRGLAVTVDGVHMNTISAKCLASLVDAAVESLP